MKNFSKIINEQFNSEQLTELNEMARYGWFGPKNKRTAFEVYVNIDDSGDIPYVHIRNYKKDTLGDEFETCVKLSTAQYFLHGRYTDTFNNKLLKDFDNFMRGKCRNKKYQNNYEYCVDMWNDNNNSKRKVRIKKDKE